MWNCVLLPYLMKIENTPQYTWRYAWTDIQLPDPTQIHCAPDAPTKVVKQYQTRGKCLYMPNSVLLYLCGVASGYTRGLQATKIHKLTWHKEIYMETSLDGFLQLPNLLQGLQIHRDQGTHGRFHGWWGFSLCWVLESWIIWTIHCDMVWYGTISKSE